MSLNGKKIEKVQSRRTKRAKSMDKARKAKQTTDVDKWAKQPNRYDMVGVDTPSNNDGRLVPLSKGETFESHWRKQNPDAAEEQDRRIRINKLNKLHRKALKIERKEKPTNADMEEYRKIREEIELIRKEDPFAVIRSNIGKDVVAHYKRISAADKKKKISEIRKKIDIVDEKIAALNRRRNMKGLYRNLKLDADGVFQIVDRPSTKKSLDMLEERVKLSKERVDLVKEYTRIQMEG